MALAARESESPLADDRVVALRERLDELVCLGGACGGLYLVSRRVRAAVGDVGRHRVGEEEALLEDDPDPAPERLEGEPADVVAVDANRTGAGVVEARHEHGGRRLPAPGRADEGDRLAGLDAEIEAGEDVAGAVIAGAVIARRRHSGSSRARS